MSQRKSVLQSEQAAGSPLRRSSRIANAPAAPPVAAPAAPATVGRRRSSATAVESSAPAKLTKSKRLSLSQDNPTEAPSTPKKASARVSRAASKSPTSLQNDKPATPAKRTRKSSAAKLEEDTQRVASPAVGPLSTRRRSVRGQSTSPTKDKPEAAAAQKPRGRRASITEKVGNLAAIEENDAIKKKPVIKSSKSMPLRRPSVDIIEIIEDEEETVPETTVSEAHLEAEAPKKADLNPIIEIGEEPEENPLEKSSSSFEDEALFKLVVEQESNSRIDPISPLSISPGKDDCVVVAEGEKPDKSPLKFADNSNECKTVALNATNSVKRDPVERDVKPKLTEPIELAGTSKCNPESGKSLLEDEDVIIVDDDSPAKPSENSAAEVKVSPTKTKKQLIADEVIEVRGSSPIEAEDKSDEIEYMEVDEPSPVKSKDNAAVPACAQVAAKHEQILPEDKNQETVVVGKETLPVTRLAASPSKSDSQRQSASVDSTAKNPQDAKKADESAAKQNILPNSSREENKSPAKQVPKRDVKSVDEEEIELNPNKLEINSRQSTERMPEPIKSAEKKSLTKSSSEEIVTATAKHDEKNVLAKSSSEEINSVTKESNPKNILLKSSPREEKTSQTTKLDEDVTSKNKLVNSVEKDLQQQSDKEVVEESEAIESGAKDKLSKSSGEKMAVTKDARKESDEKNKLAKSTSEENESMKNNTPLNDVKNGEESNASELTKTEINLITNKTRKVDAEKLDEAMKSGENVAKSVKSSPEGEKINTTPKKDAKKLEENLIKRSEKVETSKSPENVSLGNKTPKQDVTNLEGEKVATLTKSSSEGENETSNKTPKKDVKNLEGEKVAKLTKSSSEGENETSNKTPKKDVKESEEAEVNRTSENVKITKTISQGNISLSNKTPKKNAGKLEAVKSDENALLKSTPEEEKVSLSNKTPKKDVKKLEEAEVVKSSDDVETSESSAEEKISSSSKTPKKDGKKVEEMEAVKSSEEIVKITKSVALSDKTSNEMLKSNENIVKLSKSSSEEIGSLKSGENVKSFKSCEDLCKASKSTPRKDAAAQPMAAAKSISEENKPLPKKTPKKKLEDPETPSKGKAAKSASDENRKTPKPSKNDDCLIVNEFEMISGSDGSFHLNFSLPMSDVSAEKKDLNTTGGSNNSDKENMQSPEKVGAKSPSKIFADLTDFKNQSTPKGKLADLAKPLDDGASKSGGKLVVNRMEIERDADPEQELINILNECKEESILTEKLLNKSDNPMKTPKKQNKSDADVKPDSACKNKLKEKDSPIVAAEDTKESPSVDDKEKEEKVGDEKLADNEENKSSETAAKDEPSLNKTEDVETTNNKSQKEDGGAENSNTGNDLNRSKGANEIPKVASLDDESDISLNLNISTAKSAEKAKRKSLKQTSEEAAIEPNGNTALSIDESKPQTSTVDDENLDRKEESLNEKVQVDAKDKSNPRTIGQANDNEAPSEKETNLHVDESSDKDVEAKPKNKRISLSLIKDEDAAKETAEPASETNAESDGSSDKEEVGPKAKRKSVALIEEDEEAESPVEIEAKQPRGKRKSLKKQTNFEISLLSSSEGKKGKKRSDESKLEDSDADVECSMVKKNKNRKSASEDGLDGGESKAKKDRRGVSEDVFDDEENDCSKSRNDKSRKCFSEDVFDDEEIDCSKSKKDKSRKCCSEDVSDDEDEMVSAKLKLEKAKCKARKRSQSLGTSSDEGNSDEASSNEAMFSSDDSSSDDAKVVEDSDEEEIGRNIFIEDMAFEGEEDTPSEGSNDLPEYGESLHSSESDGGSSDEDYEVDSFIDDNESVELLSGNDYDLSDSENVNGKQQQQKKKRSRIISVSESDNGSEADEDKIETAVNENDEPEEKVPSKKIEIIQDIKISKPKKRDTDSADVDGEEAIASADEEPNETEKTEAINRLGLSGSKARRRSKKRTSISLQENLKMSDLTDDRISEKIAKAVDFFCSSIKESSGNVSLNVSLDYANNSSEDESQPTSAKKPKIEVDPSVAAEAETVKKSPKRKSLESVDDDPVKKLKGESEATETGGSGTDPEAAVVAKKKKKKKRTSGEKVNESVVEPEESTDDVPKKKNKSKIDVASPKKRTKESPPIPTKEYDYLPASLIAELTKNTKVSLREVSPVNKVARKKKLRIVPTATMNGTDKWIIESTRKTKPSKTSVVRVSEQLQRQQDELPANDFRNRKIIASATREDFKKILKTKKNKLR